MRAHGESTTSAPRGPAGRQGARLSHRDGPEIPCTSTRNTAVPRARPRRHVRVRSVGHAHANRCCSAATVSARTAVHTRGERPPHVRLRADGPTAGAPSSTRARPRLATSIHARFTSPGRERSSPESSSYRRDDRGVACRRDAAALDYWAPGVYAGRSGGDSEGLVEEMSHSWDGPSRAGWSRPCRSECSSAAGVDSSLTRRTRRGVRSTPDDLSSSTRRRSVSETAPARRVPRRSGPGHQRVHPEPRALSLTELPYSAPPTSAGRPGLCRMSALSEFARRHVTVALAAKAREVFAAIRATSWLSRLPKGGVAARSARVSVAQPAGSRAGRLAQRCCNEPGGCPPRLDLRVAARAPR